MPQDWNPQAYLNFATQRNRPALELLAHIRHRPAQHITDLGCGAGNSTALLREVWQHAHITGVDNSPNMLAAAREHLPSCEFIQQDFHDWCSDVSQDVIFANASLQWSPEPETLFSHIIKQLAPNGVLAIQMPDNLNEPSHRLMDEVAQLPQWRTAMQQVASRPNMLKVADYYDILVKNHCRVDIWHTVYHHVLPDVASIAQMFASTALRPYLACLDETQQIEFQEIYIQKLQQYYPKQYDGQVLLSLPRLFIVAEKIQAA